jgi:hypothetical protein
MPDHPLLQDVVHVAFHPREETVSPQNFVSVLKCFVMCNSAKRASQLARHHGSHTILHNAKHNTSAPPVTIRDGEQTQVIGLQQHHLVSPARNSVAMWKQTM